MRMKRFLARLLAFALFFPSTAFAQSPGAFTKLGLIDTSADALRVGCAIGSTGSCTGGIKAGPVVAASVTVNSVGIIGADGRIPAISSVYFASLSGANLTSLNASNLASGTVPSAVISGTYSGTVTFSASGNTFRGSHQSSDGSAGVTITCPTFGGITVKNGVVTSLTC
jgi:hypothetical protein